MKTVGCGTGTGRCRRRTVPFAAVPRRPMKTKRAPRAGVVAGVLLGEPGEALEARAQIDGLERDEDLDAGGDHRAPSARARTTAARNVGSKPGATRTRAAPTSMTRSRRNSGAAAAGRGTSPGTSPTARVPGGSTTTATCSRRTPCPRRTPRQSGRSLAMRQPAHAIAAPSRERHPRSSLKRQSPCRPPCIRRMDSGRTRARAALTFHRRRARWARQRRDAHHQRARRRSRSHGGHR